MIKVVWSSKFARIGKKQDYWKKKKDKGFAKLGKLQLKPANNQNTKVSEQTYSNVKVNLKKMGKSNRAI